MTTEPVQEIKSNHSSPVVIRLQDAPEPVEAFRRLSAWRHCVFFDSALRDETVGRYSFIAADPFRYLEVPIVGADAWAVLLQQMAEYETEPVEGLPPFQGGAAGLFGYELCHALEQLPRCRFDEFQVPPLAVGLYDVVLAYDHQQDDAWIISHGLPEIEPQRRQCRAEERAAFFRKQIEEGEPAIRETHARTRVVPPSALCPQFPVTTTDDLTSNFDRDSYLRAAERTIEYIHAGDIFQANLAQRLLYPARDDAVDLYLRLRERNAAPFAGYFDLGEFQIVSASPERFVQLRDHQVEARPIKGTRRRLSQPEADFYAGDELRQSEKDRAENVMIVDLLRNDLSKVCRPDSVAVTQLCELESYAYVQHLVSAIVGQMNEHLGPLDLLKAAFPGGSITGAPKVRAMEIIAELEPSARGPYCGSLGYVGFDGTMDTSILIRTITAGRGWWQSPVGGGIVAQSDPVAEYEETWHKAEGILRALK